MEKESAVHLHMGTGQEQQEAAAHKPSSKTGCSSTCLWALFLFGWICPPLWWAAAAAGFQSGSDSEWLIKRRKGLSTSSTIAWWGCLVMSILGAVALVLTTSIYYGRKGPEQEGEPGIMQLLLQHPAGQAAGFHTIHMLTIHSVCTNKNLTHELLSKICASSFAFKAVTAPASGCADPAGPFFITLAGEAGAFPDFSDPATLYLMAKAMHGSLNLAITYPVAGVIVWLDSTAIINSPAGSRRRLLADDLAGNETQVSVLGYNLIRTPDLPNATVLDDTMNSTAATDALAEQLVKLKVVSEEHLGKLLVGLISSHNRDKLAAMQDGKPDNPAFNLVPVGECTS